jgi:endoglucanase
VGTVQEEVGSRGAKTTSNMIKPDISIAVDVGIASDTPGLSGDAKIGEGPLLLLVDGALVGHVGLRNFIVGIADELKIPYQFDFLARGGTDAGAMHLAHSGSPAISLCVASRYIHSHTSIIAKKDFDHAVKLITEVVKRLDRKMIDEITYI